MALAGMLVPPLFSHFGSCLLVEMSLLCPKPAYQYYKRLLRALTAFVVCLTALMQCPQPSALVVEVCIWPAEKQVSDDPQRTTHVPLP